MLSMQQTQRSYILYILMEIVVVSRFKEALFKRNKLYEYNGVPLLLGGSRLLPESHELCC